MDVCSSGNVICINDGDDDDDDDDDDGNGKIFSLIKSWSSILSNIQYCDHYDTRPPQNVNPIVKYRNQDFEAKRVFLLWELCLSQWRFLFFRLFSLF